MASGKPVGNVPFPWYKTWVYSGGVKDPLIIRYPKAIKDAGGIREQYEHVIDITPTVLDLLGLEKPDHVKGVIQKKMQGKSFDQVYVTFQIGKKLGTTNLITVGRRNSSVGINSVGEDALTAVSEDYDAPFTFEGKINKLSIDVAPFDLVVKEEIDKFFMLD